MGRPISWPKKISAPPEAIAFYEALAIAIKSEAFAQCHVFHGAKNKNSVPVILDGGSLQTVLGPALVGAYLGHAKTGRRTCGTPGCLNPLHYTDLSSGPAHHYSTHEYQPVLNDAPPLEDWVELVRYLRDSKDITAALTFQQYRELVPEEDVPDNHLRAVFNMLPPTWKIGEL